MPTLRAALAAVCASSAAVLAQAGAEPPRYGRDVRPLLADRCFRCHGPDAGTREAELRLDLRDVAVAGRDGGAAIVPGDHAASLLYQRITSAAERQRMPPRHSGLPPLTPAETNLLARWIDAGASYEPHWAFAPPVQPGVPPLAAHPVDAFLIQALSRRGLDQSPPADAETQVRRLFLTLTGLPPTPEEIDQFAAAAAGASDAWERLVDRLLGEEPYATRHAEHLAGVWLDAARYADTSGIHMDAGRQAWVWRDWLLEALHTDLPYDRFVVEQLAGDLLPDAAPSQHIATGFLRHHVTSDEGGAIDADYLVEYAAERTNTVGSVFLGLTVGCARCHDHKYDPLRQEDYYRLFAFFNNNDEPGVYSQEPDPDRALEPFLRVPSTAQAAEAIRLDAERDLLRAALEAVAPGDQRAFHDFLATTSAAFGLDWQRPTAVAATSTGGATMVIEADGSVLATGPSPATDVHVVHLVLTAPQQRWLCIEALPDPEQPHGRPGRAPNGNAVLQHVRLEVRTGPGEAWQAVPLVWAAADMAQTDGDFAASNVLVADGRGWAIAAHLEPPGPRQLLLLAGEPFGATAGSELRVALAYDSAYPQHSLARVRFATSAAAPAALARLPVARGGCYVAGPFVPAGDQDGYATAAGPEAARTLPPAAADDILRFAAGLDAERVHVLAAGRNVHCIATRLFAPAPRQLAVAIGSDDGFQLFLDGVQVAERRVDRGAAVDQDEVVVPLDAGEHLLVLKVVNTGGDGGFALRLRPEPDELPAELLMALAPAPLADGATSARLARAFQRRWSPAARAQRAQLAVVEQQAAALAAAVPRAMVMRERPESRPTFVLHRGEYDRPDPQRPVARGLPELFGALPPGGKASRLDLANWLVSPANPLFDRVAVNRLWQFVFGAGLVRTSEDFGHQGEWPSHPELLDWLAVEFRARGHSTRALLRLLVTSATFRQASRVRHHEVDPDNRLLSWFPRRRLAAEALRDQALYTAGLLIERRGGPSVKPYQPPGLWEEVAMVQSNTRSYARGDGEALWRRSLYTYWKRACPPPNLLPFDAPTREYCTIRRSATNTPLQALVLWNDEQFVEAARVLAERCLAAPGGDAVRLEELLRRTTGRRPAAGDLEALRAALELFRARFAAEPAAAAALTEVGAAPRRAGGDTVELAAFAMLANACLSLDAAIHID